MTLLLLAVASLLPGGSQAAEVGECGGIGLRDVARESGLRFRHRTGAAGEKHLPETMGAGLAWLDHDGDGWLDLYLVQSGPFPPAGRAEAANRLFRNRGDGTFEERRSGAEDGRYGLGALAADLDGDGLADLYVTNFGRDSLYWNEGGRFRRAASEALPPGEAWGSAAAAGDLDGDGDLDLYVTRYVEYEVEAAIICGEGEMRRYCDPSLFRGAADRLLVNGGDGSFADAGESMGLAPADGRGLGVAISDLDGDLVPEIYVANDLTPNFLFRRDAETGGFEDRSLLSGAAVNRDGRPEAGMGVAVTDSDGDLAPEIAVTNFDVETNTLYRNEGDLTFSDVSAASGFGLPSFNLLGFGIVAADLDLDGREDLYVANGHIFERPGRDNVAYAQPDQLFTAVGDGGYRESPCAFLTELPTVSRGAAAADYDNDGDLDVAVQESGGPVRLLRNEIVTGRWLGLRLVGAAPNTGGIGARATLSQEARTQVRWAMAGGSYQSTSDPRLHFGLGAERAERIELLWPTGKRQRFMTPPGAAYLTLYEARPGR